VHTTFSLTRLAAGLSTGVLALALTGCGGSSSDAGSATSSAAAGSPTSSSAGSSSAADSTGTAVTATEADFSVALSSSTLPAGTYTFTVANTGKATHSLTVEGPGGVNVTSDKIQGGQTTTMTVTLQKGTYEVYCPIGNHRTMGMATTLTVD
jgi:plastocyanin